MTEMNGTRGTVVEVDHDKPAPVHRSIRQWSASFARRFDKAFKVKLDLGDKGGRVQFVEKPNVDPMAVIRLIQGQPKHYRMDGPDKLRIALDLADAATRSNAARGLLAALQPG